MSESSRWPAAAWAVGLPLFVILATANGAGYRYGVSDQAFYIPATQRAIEPQLFPRDAPLIDSQARLMVLDEALGAAARITDLSLPVLFAIGYFASLALIWLSLMLIGSALYRSPWTTAALMLAFTMRHRIPKTSANSLEPYFHPRMLAFGVAALAIAALLRRHSLAALALLIVSIAIHPTIGLFFGILIGTALLVCDRRLRPWLLAVAVIGLLGALWVLTVGPMREGLAIMDGEWRRALAGKDYIFPGTWPAWAWIANLAFYAIWWWAYTVRRRRGAATREDAGLLAGGGALVAIFLATLPVVSIGVAFFVQLQIPRVFWMLDFLATVYALGAIEPASSGARHKALATVLFVFSAARGVYSMGIEHPERALFALTITDSPWLSAMRWMQAQPRDTEVLADPGHAWKYGTSVRVAASRDVFVEEVKDSAIAMYSRPIAMRVLERLAAAGRFDSLTADRARALAARYDLDYLVTTARLDLPVAYRNQQFVIYSLRR